MDQVATLRARVAGVVVLSLLVCFPQESRAAERMPGLRNSEKELYQAAVERGQQLGWRTVAGSYVFTFPDGTVIREITGTGSTPVLSPNATQVVFSENRSSSIEAQADPVDLVVEDLETGLQHPLGLTARGVGLLAWSPDGQMLAVIAEEATTNPKYPWSKETVYGRLTGQIPEKPARLFVFSLTDRTLETFELPDLNVARTDQIWSPDGKEILYIALRDFHPSLKHPPLKYEIHILTLSTRETRFLVRGSMPTWSPKGDWIAFRGEDGNCYRMRPDSSEQTLLLRPRSGWLYDLAGPSLWSPDGQWLLVQLDAGFDQFDSYVLDPETGIKVKVKAQAGGSWKGRRE